MAKDRGWRIDPAVCRNPESAKEYNALGEQLYNSPKRMYHTSNGKLLNMFGLTGHIKKHIVGLPEEECEEIWELYKWFHENLLKLGRLKRDAFMAYGGAVPENTEMLEPVKAKVLEWFGTLHSESEILEKLAMEGIPASPGVLKRFKIRFKDTIEKLQSEYEREWHTIGITRKRARLDQLAYMYNKIRKEFDDVRGSQRLPFSKEMRELLTQVKREVEGDSVNVNIKGEIDVKTTLQMTQSVEELYANINFLSLLIGRVAARTRVNPIQLQYYLHTSWYARFSGVIRNQKLFDENPIYPSSTVLNWDTIREKHQERSEELAKVTKDSGIVDAVILEGEGKKRLTDLVRKRIKALEEPRSLDK